MTRQAKMERAAFVRVAEPSRSGRLRRPRGSAKSGGRVARRLYLERPFRIWSETESKGTSCWSATGVPFIGRRTRGWLPNFGLVCASECGLLQLSRERVQDTIQLGAGASGAREAACVVFVITAEELALRKRRAASTSADNDLLALWPRHEEP